MEIRDLCRSKFGDKNFSAAIGEYEEVVVLLERTVTVKEGCKGYRIRIVKSVDKVDPQQPTRNAVGILMLCVNVEDFP